MRECLGDYDVVTYLETAVREEIAELKDMRSALLSGEIESPPWGIVQDSIANIDKYINSWTFMLKTAHNGICTRYIDNSPQIFSCSL